MATVLIREALIVAQSSRLRRCSIERFGGKLPIGEFMQLSDAVTADAQDAYGTSFNTVMTPVCVLEFFDGTLPADTTDPDDGTMVVSCDLSDPPGTMTTALQYTFDAISVGTAVANGTVSYWRLKDSGGTVHMQGTVGLTGTDIELDDVDFVIADTLTMASLVIRLSTVYP
jgi:hypothetical protein